MRRSALLLLAAHLLAPSPGRAAEAAAAGALLLSAYPEQLTRVEGGDLVWRDGTHMALSEALPKDELRDDWHPEKSFAEWLARPSLADMFRLPYPTGPITAPARDFDPGRARNAAFFTKMYGDCRKGEVEHNLVAVAWLPSRSNTQIKVTRVNGVAERLRNVSVALDKLPARFDAYLLPPAGGYTCRTIAGTSQISGHGYGIAVDIATAQANYWRWTKSSGDEGVAWRNHVPEEIVRIFEAHGFIWGGRWYHYDTMHFEYRPELLAPR